MTKKHTYKYVYNYFKEQDCELLEKKYINSNTKMRYRCSCTRLSTTKFGNFRQGKRCMDCGGRKRLITEEFIKRVKEIHKDKYDYSKVEYKNTGTKVIIICPEHGEFLKSPEKHLIGQGCQKCSIENFSKKMRGNKNRDNKNRDNKNRDGKNRDSNITFSTEEFVKKAKKVHGNKYDYSKVEYSRAWDPVIIICPEHGEFLQIPNNHLRGANCLKCAGKNVFTTEEFIEKAIKVHGDKYNYSKVNYINSKTKIVIICPKHGSFNQVPNSHLNGAGCSHCIKKNEGKVKELLLKYFKDWRITSHKKVWDRYKDYSHRRFCDFWLEKDGIKIMTEYDGPQHSQKISFWSRNEEEVNKIFKDYQIKDKLDAEFCKENNIILHRIKYKEDKEERIKELLSIINKNKY